MIIGLAGTIGAGKGTVVDYLKSKGFAHYSSSGILKEILTERGLPHTRDHFSPLGTELREKDEGGVPKIGYERSQKEGQVNVILEAIHSEGEAAFVKSVGGVIIGVDADPKIRYERASKRAHEKDNVTFEEFLAHSAREDEGQGEGHNIRAVINAADYVVENNGSLEDLHSQIDRVLEQVGASG